MNQDVAPHPLDPDHVLPSEANPKVPEGPSSPVSAAVAVRRSMPMALSICLGILLAALAGWFFYYLTWFLLLLYLSFVAATILEAPVQWLKRHGIRRGFAAVIVMVGGLLVAGTGIYFIGSGVYGQVEAVRSNIDQAPKRINDWVNGWRNRFATKAKDTGAGPGQTGFSKGMPGVKPTVAAPPEPFHIPNARGTDSNTDGAPAEAVSRPASAPADAGFDVKKSLSNEAPGIATIGSTALKAIESISWLVIMFFLVLYMLVDGADHLKAVRGLLPKHMRLESTKLFNEISKAHRGWGFASVANVCSASILTGTGLYFLGVPGAVILGFMAGLGELIPNIGPFVGAMPALVLTLVMDSDKFWYVAGMFVIVQTIQSYGISPQMLKFSIELPVLVTIISVLVFGTLFGFLGILVAIPFVADMVVVWNFVGAWREKDTQDYDRMNGPAEETRRAVGGRQAKFGKLFRRGKPKAAESR